MSKHKLNNSDCNKLYKNIISLIRNSESEFFKLKKLRGVMGYCEWEVGIFLDYRKEFFTTLIHECIHYLKPDWSETQVLYAEKKIINYITIKQLIKLIKTFADKL